MIKNGFRNNISFLLLILLWNCSDISYMGPYEPLVELSYETIPYHATIGQQIKIFDNLPDSLNASRFITFTGVGDWIWADSIVNDTMFAIVPFTAISGPVKIVDDPYYNYSVIGEVDSFIVTDNSIDYVHVMWSDLSYPITEEMSDYSTYFSPNPWQIEQRNDTTQLYIRVSTGDVGWSHQLILIDKGVNQLPEFVSGHGEDIPDVASEWKIYPLEKGIIKIEKWDISDRIIGRVFGPPWTFNEYCFNINMQ